MISIFKVFAILLMSVRVRAWGEVAVPVCKINNKKDYSTGSSCAAKVDQLADDGVRFAVAVRADATDVLSQVLEVARKYGKPGVIQPLLAAARKGLTDFKQTLVSNMKEGRVVGWQVGHSVGGIVGKLAGGATLGSLGFVAGAQVGGIAGFATGALPLMAVASVCPACAAVDFFLAAVPITTAMGTLAGAERGARLGVEVGAASGGDIGGALGGFLGQEIGGTIGVTSTLAHGLLFQLGPGVSLAIDYVRGQDGAMKLISYHVVVNQDADDEL